MKLGIEKALTVLKTVNMHTLRLQNDVEDTKNIKNMPEYRHQFN